MKSSNSASDRRPVPVADTNSGVPDPILDSLGASVEMLSYGCPHICNSIVCLCAFPCNTNKSIFLNNTLMKIQKMNISGKNDNNVSSRKDLKIKH